MLYRLFTLCLLLALVFLSMEQQCLNKDNKKVDWWLVIQIPDAISTGYAYFDSRFAAPTLAVYPEQPDVDGTPLSRTLDQVQNLSMYTISWNDQLPNGSTSSTKAHSKSISAYDPKTQTGFFIAHSIPQYPAFINNVVNRTINISQQKYGQHLLCISGDKLFMLNLITKVMPIRPNVYNLNYDCQKILNETLHFINTPPNYDSEFSYFTVEMAGTPWKMIFKNGYKNSSIFEDGVNNMLNSSLVAQTWGRPLQSPWCGSEYNTGNIKQIKLSEKMAWKTTQDHSKWLVMMQNDYSCFGDMNRMDSQWKRGGAFYCLQSQLLSIALKSAIKSTQTCGAKQAKLWSIGGLLNKFANANANANAKANAN